ncbi:MAG: hypothetical protein HXX19_09635 [Rhodoferax sp.]|nr:hypothetical protein [Rhodoferax sp.]
MKLFNIVPPTDAALALSMALVMLSAMHEDMELEGFEEPDQKLATLIAHLSPQEQRQALDFAYADAVASGRKALRESDFEHLQDESERG